MTHDFEEYVRQQRLAREFRELHAVLPPVVAGYVYDYKRADERGDSEDMDFLEVGAFDEFTLLLARGDLRAPVTEAAIMRRELDLVP